MRCIYPSDSRMIRLGLAFAASTVFFMVSAAQARQSADTQPQSVNAPVAPAESPQDQRDMPRRLTWDFDKDPVDGWHYACHHALVFAKSGRALQVSGGHAIWDPVGRITDFVLEFHYCCESGAGEVFFRLSKTSLGEECYCLKLAPDHITLARRLNKPTDEGYPEKELISKTGVLKPHKGYAITIRAKGARIDVLIGGQEALSYLDPHPLTDGTFGLGADNRSVVLYDNVVLTAVLTRATDSSP
ncbi:MAG: hypothetical protein JW719_06395 [Pirellulales bacterium]|nr:hypothetical protein [Pirellulales bacterium]